MTAFVAKPMRIVPGHARDPITGERLSDFAKFVDKVTAIDLTYDPAFDPFALAPEMPR